jgi:hypothetical protein
MKNTSLQSGYIALTTVLIIIVTAVFLSTIITIRAIDFGRRGQSYREYLAAYMLASSCTEETFLQIREDPNYSTTTLNFATGSCTININRQGSTYEIITTASTTRDLNTTAVIASQIERRSKNVRVIDFKTAY